MFRRRNQFRIQYCYKTEDSALRTDQTGVHSWRDSRYILFDTKVSKINFQAAFLHQRKEIYLTKTMEPCFK
jgi:hypothetical protein